MPKLAGTNFVAPIEGGIIMLNSMKKFLGTK